MLFATTIAIRAYYYREYLYITSLRFMTRIQVCYFPECARKIKMWIQQNMKCNFKKNYKGNIFVCILDTLYWKSVFQWDSLKEKRKKKEQKKKKFKCMESSLNVST